MVAMSFCDVKHHTITSFEVRELDESFKVKQQSSLCIIHYHQQTLNLSPSNAPRKNGVKIAVCDEK